MAAVSVSGITTLDSSLVENGNLSTIFTNSGLDNGGAIAADQNVGNTDRVLIGQRLQCADGGGASDDESGESLAGIGTEDFTVADRLLVFNFTVSNSPTFLIRYEDVAGNGINIITASAQADWRRWTIGGTDQQHNDICGYGIATVIEVGLAQFERDSNGTLDLSAITEITITSHRNGTTGTMRTVIGWLGYIDPLILIGGDGGDPDGVFDDWFIYAEGDTTDSENIPTNMIQKFSGGALYIASCIIQIGDGGSNVVVMTDDIVTTVDFTQNIDIDPLFLAAFVSPNIFGFRIDAGASDVINVSNKTLSSVSPWKLDIGGSTAATINLFDFIIRGAGEMNIQDAVDWAGTVFDDDAAMLKGGASVDNTTFRNNSRAPWALELDSTTDADGDLDGLTFEDYAADPTTAVFDGQDDVDATLETLTITGHGWPIAAIQRVLYDAGADDDDIGGLVDETIYYAKVLDPDTVSMHTTLANAQSDTRINLSDAGGTSATNVLIPTRHGIRITATGTYAWASTSFDGSGTADVINESGGLVTLNISAGGTPPSVTNVGAATTVIVNAVTLRITALDAGSPIEGAFVQLIATETVGTITIDDVLLEGLTNASGIVEDTAFNYEAAFDPSGLDFDLSVAKGSEVPTYIRQTSAGVILPTGFTATANMVSDD